MQPLGFEQGYGFVCRLRKALHNLKQATTALFAKLNSALLELHFVASKLDTSLFIWDYIEVYMVILTYVDDIIMTDRSLSHANALISFLYSQFTLKDLGILYYFFILEIIIQCDVLA